MLLFYYVYLSLILKCFVSSVGLLIGIGALLANTYNFFRIQTNSSVKDAIVSSDYARFCYKFFSAFVC